MLVLLGPDFDGSPEAYTRLAQATGLVAYDLKARLKPGSWGVIKAFGDIGAARDLAGKLNAAGFSPVLVERGVAQDPERRIVPVAGIRLEESEMVLLLRDREMPVPYQALCCIVEGEVQIGRTQAYQAPPSSTSFRAPTPAELANFTQSTVQAPSEAFLAADFHFVTVVWIARIDVRHFDFGTARTGSIAQDLEILIARIAERAGNVRIDRSVKTSSVASFAMQKAVPSGGSWPPVSNRMKEDQRFDPYSRIVGEAERQYRLGTVGNAP
jgi:hypothetical protein